MILFSGYWFVALLPAKGCASARAMRLLSAKHLSFHGNLKRQDKNQQKEKSKKAPRIRLFQDLRKNSPPKWKAYFVLKFVALDSA
jgi:hypothetical protein